MFRQVPSRNHRSRGLKVKHVLQICLLLAICIWLLYQFKHSHDKKEVFDENTSKIATNIDDDHEILKFGRKNLNHGVEMAYINEKHGEEEESEEEEGIEGSHEILKLGRKDLINGVEMTYKNDKFAEEEEHEEGIENVDEERGGGVDEVDEHDQEEVDEEADRGEYFTEEEKEAREKDLEKEEKEENEEKGGRGKDVDSSENRDQDGDDRNSQEAREEHYKADDASSAVVRDNQMIRSEVENDELRNSEEVHVDNIERINLENEHETNISEDSTLDEIDSSPNAGELPISIGDGETTVKNPSVNATNDEKGVVVSLSGLENDYLSNMTTVESSDQTALHNTAIVYGTETPTLYLKSETTILNSIQDQNATFKVGTFDQEKPNSETFGLKQTEKSSLTTVSEETQTIVLEQTEKSNATDVAKEANNIVLEQTIAAKESQQIELEQTEKSNTTNAVEESDDTAMSSLATSENSDAVHKENTDSSSSLVTQEEKDDLRDLETLPQIESERRNTEDAAAE